MDNLKDDSYYIQRVINDINFLIRHTKDITKDKFAKEELLLDSIMFRFIQISEHIKKLTPTFKARHDKIPWKDITGLRNRIVHEYGNIDLNIIYTTIKRDIYIIRDLFEAIEQN